MKINKVKDCIYETEGLLELLNLRPEKSDALLPLVESRLRQALSLVDALKAGNEPSQGDSQCVPETSGETSPGEFPPTDLEDPVFEITDDSDPDLVADEASEALETLACDGEAGQGHRQSDDSAQHTPHAKSSPVFCLNDRFRFRRAIFGGSDEDFNAALNLLPSFESYDEAEEYFLGELGLNLEDEDVADFMDIIKNYFGQ